ncbi:SWIM zinc finger family protein [Rubellicoccus peritrichatus]|uniref:SWIM zinc finger family protein n=1 Tax=Rubellicoccus peritrichatus TaxID=3080537 RepID=A0AAQ3LED6_9BACT|nr:SWIM zinc finger family protein [Puniceicoccus sp. CR14]WOO43147.1 SWIM zinc finger family protein [Puniceicoccus sp. CR14]
MKGEYLVSVTEQFDNPLRFTVQSSSRPNEVHMVDVGAYKGNGRCSCEHFKIRLEKKLHAGAKPRDGLRCKHILAARHYFCDIQIKAMKTVIGAEPQNCEV